MFLPQQAAAHHEDHQDQGCRQQERARYKHNEVGAPANQVILLAHADEHIKNDAADADSRHRDCPAVGPPQRGAEYRQDSLASALGRLSDAGSAQPECDFHSRAYTGGNFGVARLTSQLPAQPVDLLFDLNDAHFTFYQGLVKLFQALVGLVEQVQVAGIL